MPIVFYGIRITGLSAEVVSVECNASTATIATTIITIGAQIHFHKKQREEQLCSTLMRYRVQTYKYESMQWYVEEKWTSVPLKYLSLSLSSAYLCLLASLHLPVRCSSLPLRVCVGSPPLALSLKVMLHFSPISRLFSNVLFVCSNTK